jgi:alpha-N-acetylglucosamine transferase
MIFYTVLIQNELNNSYSRLCNALCHSVAFNTNYVVEVVEVAPDNNPKDTHHYQHYIEQTVKLRAWDDIIQREKNGTKICLIDADTIVLKELDHVFDNQFDIAYTKQPTNSKIRLNTGVLFVKVNDRTKRFFHDWRAINERMQADEVFHKKWHPNFHGMDQTSFGYMTKQRTFAKLIGLPCEMYNACGVKMWANLNDKTHVLHIKAQLREACLSVDPLSNILYQSAIRKWLEYDN